MNQNPIEGTLKPDEPEKDCPEVFSRITLAAEDDRPASRVRGIMA